MDRHHFLKLVLGAGAASAGLSRCAPVAAQRAVAGAALPASAPARRYAPSDGSVPPSTGGSRRPIAALCFDLFTLFDPRSVVDAARTFAPDQAAALCETWRVRQFEYAWLRVAAGRYQDFRQVTGDALDYAARVHGLTLSVQQREALIVAYSTLRPWPDTATHLERWQQLGLRMAPLANYSPSMLSALLANAGLSQYFEFQLSTDLAQSFKPDPRAYALGVSAFGLAKEQIAFCAFGGWDAAGAKWFGYPTFWVNRLAVSGEQLPPGPDGMGPTLAEFAQFIERW